MRHAALDAAINTGSRARLIVGISGASGVAYGARLLTLLQAQPIETHLVMTRTAEVTLALETDLKAAELRARADVTHAIGDMAAPISSGSFQTLGMIVAPCSVRSMSEIATGVTTTLLTRAADVVLKERRRLVLAVRETPLHTGHLRTMISADLDQMRPSVLPNLLDAARRNADRGIADVAIYEVGPIYRDDTPEGQSNVAGGLRAGMLGPRDWRGKSGEPDLFVAKEDALAALAAAGAPIDNLQVSGEPPAWFHPGRSGILRLGPAVLAHFGEVHPEILDAFDLKGSVAAFETFIDAVALPRAARTRPLLRLSVFQPVERDYAFIVDRDVPAGTLLRAARGVDRKLVAEIRLFDVYEGKGLPEGKKSLALAVTLQPQDATLTDSEIDAFSASLVAAVEKATGGTLRG